MLMPQKRRCLLFLTIERFLIETDTDVFAFLPKKNSTVCTER
jgi:hypothetical protein